MIRIKDLVEVPEVKTVIQLKDLQESGLRQMILHSFVVTQEAKSNLKMILTSLAGTEGRGIFLKGHFGSGKSHFLSILSLLLRHPASWDLLLSQEPSLKDFPGKIQASKYLVVEVSLIQHRGSEFLEDIFLKALFQELSLQTGRPFEPALPRHETFQEVRKVMGRHGFSKLIFLVDELSEFLRSKTDAHAYQEDIRFLQYLGEEAFSFPLWIIASLQEWIEETGEINQDTFNKIKDRYPVRISLGQSHLEELVSHRLIRHREGADQEIRNIYQSLRRFFPHFPVDESRFSKLYPVHPATITLLDQLKPLFSEHRGMVDFIHYRLKGDTERGIPSFLGNQAQALLGPAVIFDHFLHRIRETAETQPFADKVFVYYQDEIPNLLTDREQQQVALEAVKLLILIAIAPAEIRYTLKHLADMILFRVTDLDSNINYQYLWEILDRLSQESPYLTRVPGPDPLSDRFLIKLQADLAGIMRQRVRQGASEIFSGDRRLFDRLLPLADSPHLPFIGWADQGQQRVSLSWEYTRRHGLIYLRPIDQIRLQEIEEMARSWKRSEEDFFILVAPAIHLDEQYHHLRERLLPGLRNAFPASPFLFWIPAAVSEEDEDWLKGMLSALILKDGASEESSESRRPMKPLLEEFLKQGSKRLGEIFNRAYFNGLLIGDDRQIELSSFGYLSQEKFLDEFVPPLLTRRFPKHHRIHPYIEALAPTSLPALLNDFFATGRADLNDRTQFGLRTILDNLLKPMGLIKKKGNHQYFLNVEPRSNELAETFLAFLDKGPVPEETLYWSFRKGEYGLLKHQYDVLLYALLYSGNILAFQGQRRKGLEDISRSGLQGITAFDRGEILSEEYRRLIPNHPLIPEKWKKGTLTLPTQDALWQEIKSQMVQDVEAIRTLLQRLLWASSFQAFKNLPWAAFRQDAQDVLAQWEEVKASLPAREGLERFLGAAQRDPFLSEKLARLAEVRSFFEQADKVLVIYQYLSHPKLTIPDRPVYDKLRAEKEELLRFFESGAMTIDLGTLRSLITRFEAFRDEYIQAYVDLHQRMRSGEQFRPYEKIRQSRRFQLLSRLDRLEMISVQHDLGSINSRLAEVLISQCETPSIESLQNKPVCHCEFQMTTEPRFPPLREIEEAVDQGIRETIEALQSPPYQEKLIPFLKGLEEVGEKEKALAVQRVLAFSESKNEDLVFDLDQALTPLAVQGINEAFQGRVVVVNRDLDQLYMALIRRKYTLSQVHKIFRDWLKDQEISPTTFVHFLGRGEAGGELPQRDKFFAFIEERFSLLLPLIQETGQAPFKQALLLSLWIEGYGLPPQSLFTLFPFLEKGKAERGLVIISQLAQAAGLLRQKEPALFETLVLEVEKEEGFTARVWRLLEGEKAAQIFVKERVFLSILKEAFERLLIGTDGDKEIQRLLSEPDLNQPSDLPQFHSSRSRLIEALREYVALLQKAQALKRRESNPPQDFQKWESFFLQHLSPLASLLSGLPDRLERMEISLPSPVRERIIETRKKGLSINKPFTEFYQRALPLWEKGEARRPKMIEDLPSRGLIKGPLAEEGEEVFLLLDGMRCDLWEYLKEKFFGPLAGSFRVIQEGVLWSHFPSTTPTQMEFFNQAWEKHRSKSRKKEPELWKIGGIDERVHTEKGSLEYLFRNILQYLQLELAPRLRDLPPRTTLILFSDHGFIENPQFEKTDKYRHPRYLHGEASPLEILVPWAVMVKM
ncbi:MAG: DUF6079 family protein [Thermodesulfobacteriota bacterium]